MFIQADKHLWDGIALGLAHALPMQLVELLIKCHENHHIPINNPL